MRILVTNDDGVASPGLIALAEAAVRTGAEVVVIAPAVDYSGCGAGIAPAPPSGDAAFASVDLPGLAGVVAYAVDGPPALAVLSAGLGPYRPDIVLSGVNRGLNVGTGVLHSGTVGAALTAANIGIPAVAVSLDAGPDPGWHTAATVAVAVVEWLHVACLPVAVNLNVPDVSLTALAGVRAARLGRGEAVLDQLGLGDDTDAAMVRQGFATVTVLHGLHEAGRETGTEAADFATGRLRGGRPGRVAVATP